MAGRWASEGRNAVCREAAGRWRNEKVCNAYNSVTHLRAVGCTVYQSAILVSNKGHSRVLSLGPFARKNNAEKGAPNMGSDAGINRVFHDNHQPQLGLRSRSHRQIPGDLLAARTR